MANVERDLKLRVAEQHVVIKRIVARLLRLALRLRLGIALYPAPRPQRLIALRIEKLAAHSAEVRDRNRAFPFLAFPDQLIEQIVTHPNRVPQCAPRITSTGSYFAARRAG